MKANPVFIQKANKVTNTLDSMKGKKFVSRDEFTDVMNDADAVATEDLAYEHISDHVNYLWKRYQAEMDAYTKKGGDPDTFNTVFLVKKLRVIWHDFVKMMQNKTNKEESMEQKENRMRGLLREAYMCEDKKYTADAAFEIADSMRRHLNDMATDISRVKTIAIDYQSVNTASSIEVAFKRLQELVFSLVEDVSTARDAEEKKAAKKKAEAEVEEIEAGEEEIPELPELPGEEEEDIDVDVNVDLPEFPDEEEF